jgi:integrase
MATISTLTRGGKVIGFQSNLGRDPHGKARRKFHRSLKEAQAFVEAESSGDLGTGELYQRRAEIMFCLQQLRKVNANLNEAVEFYLKHGAKKGNPPFDDVVKEFLEEKRQAGRRDKYLEGLEDKWSRFSEHLGKGKLIGDITTEQIKDYVYLTRGELGDTTKTDYLRGLSVLFNYGIQKKYIGLNPTKGVTRPNPQFRAPKILSPGDFEILLNRCLKKGWHDRLTIFVLVGFCGIRTEEACKLRWDNIDMENQKVMVPETVAKKARFRRNLIPPNAMKWLEAAHDKRRTGPIIGPNAKRLLNVAVRFAHIGYSQNCLRHSFCSYSIEAGVPVADVAASLGHTESLAVLHAHYRNIVEKKDALQWWNLVPNIAA